MNIKRESKDTHHASFDGSVGHRKSSLAIRTINGVAREQRRAKRKSERVYRRRKRGIRTFDCVCAVCVEGGEGRYLLVNRNPGSWPGEPKETMGPRNCTSSFPSD